MMRFPSNSKHQFAALQRRAVQTPFFSRQVFVSLERNFSTSTSGSDKNKSTNGITFMGTEGFSKNVHNNTKDTITKRELREWEKGVKGVIDQARALEHDIKPQVKDATSTLKLRYFKFPRGLGATKKTGTASNTKMPEKAINFANLKSKNAVSVKSVSEVSGSSTNKTKESGIFDSDSGLFPTDSGLMNEDISELNVAFDKVSKAKDALAFLNQKKTSGSNTSKTSDSQITGFTNFANLQSTNSNNSPSTSSRILETKTLLKKSLASTSSSVTKAEKDTKATPVSAELFPHLGDAKSSKSIFELPKKSAEKTEVDSSVSDEIFPHLKHMRGVTVSTEMFPHLRKKKHNGFSSSSSSTVQTAVGTHSVSTSSNSFYDNLVSNSYSVSDELSNEVAIAATRNGVCNADIFGNSTSSANKSNIDIKRFQPIEFKNVSPPGGFGNFANVTSSIPSITEKILVDNKKFSAIAEAAAQIKSQQTPASGKSTAALMMDKISAIKARAKNIDKTDADRASLVKNAKNVSITTKVTNNVTETTPMSSIKPMQEAFQPLAGKPTDFGGFGNFGNLASSSPTITGKVLEQNKQFSAIAQAAAAIKSQQVPTSGKTNADRLIEKVAAIKTQPKKVEMSGTSVSTSGSFSAQANSSAKDGTNGNGGGSSSSNAASISDEAALVTTYDPPAFPIRVALVGSAVSLLTPAFAVGGFVVLWHRYLPTTLLGNTVKNMSTVGLGCGSIGLSVQYLIPFLQNHGDLVMPVALANAAAASFWYGVLEKKFGLKYMAGEIDTAGISKRFKDSSLFKSFVNVEKAAISATNSGSTINGAGKTSAEKMDSFTNQIQTARIPAGGVMVGALTASTNFLLFPSFINNMLDKELVELLLPMGASAISDLYTYILVPVALPVGAAAGLALHELLQPLIIGKGTRTAANTNNAGGANSENAGGVSNATLALLFLLGGNAGYFLTSRTDLTALRWERRLDPKTGLVYSSRDTRAVVCSEENVENGGALASSATSLLGGAQEPIVNLDLWRPDAAAGKRSVLGAASYFYSGDNSSNDGAGERPSRSDRLFAGWGRAGSFASVWPFTAEKDEGEKDKTAPVKTAPTEEQLRASLAAVSQFNGEKPAPLKQLSEHQELCAIVDVILRMQALQKGVGSHDGKLPTLSSSASSASKKDEVLAQVVDSKSPNKKVTLLNNESDLIAYLAASGVAVDGKRVSALGAAAESILFERKNASPLNSPVLSVKQPGKSFSSAKDQLAYFFPDERHAKLLAANIDFLEKAWNSEKVLLGEPCSASKSEVSKLKQRVASAGYWAEVNESTKKGLRAVYNGMQWALFTASWSVCPTTLMLYHGDTNPVASISSATTFMILWALYGPKSPPAE